MKLCKDIVFTDLIKFFLLTYIDREFITSGKTANVVFKGSNVVHIYDYPAVDLQEAYIIPSSLS